MHRSSCLAWEEQPRQGSSALPAQLRASCGGPSCCLAWNQERQSAGQLAVKGGRAAAAMLQGLPRTAEQGGS